MKKQGIKKNFIYQFLYKLIVLVIPLVLSPYLTRTLGDTALGTFTFVNSIAYYFLIFAMLGISRYGQRLISASSKEEIGKNFYSLLTLHAIVSLISIVLYFAFVFFAPLDDKIIYYIEGLYVASALFDVTWLFYGLENFKNVVIRDLIVKIVECILIFVFVKSASDLWIYTLITAGGLLIGNAVIIPAAIRNIKYQHFSWNDCIKHIRPLFLLFISVVAVSLYTVFDKTILGIMSTKENVAYYAYAEKLVNIPKTILNIIGIVIFPRACKLVSDGNDDALQPLFKKAVFIEFLMGSAFVFGIISIAQPLAIIYYGESFSATGPIIAVLSPLILIIGFGELLRSIFVLPLKKDKYYVLIYSISAAINVIVSVVLTLFFDVYGVVIGTLLAEIVGFICQFVICRKHINVVVILKEALPFVGIGVLMFLSIKLFDSFLEISLQNLIIEIFIGATVYLLLAGLYVFVFKKEYFILAKQILMNKIKKQ